MLVKGTHRQRLPPSLVLLTSLRSWHWTVQGRAQAVPVLCTLLYVLVLLSSVRVVPDRALLGPLTLTPGQDGWRVGWLWPGSVAWDLGLRAGDLVQVPGHAAPFAEDALHTAPVLLVRTPAGRLFPLDLVAQASAAQGNASTLGLGLFFYLLALAVFLRARDRPAARAFFVLFASAGVALTLMWPAALGQPWAVGLEFVMVACFGCAWANFFLIFASRPRATAPLRFVLLALPVLVIVVLYAAALVVDVAWYDLAQRLRGLVTLAGIGGGYAWLIASLLRRQTRDERRLLAVLALGTVAGITPFLLCTLLPSIGGRSPLVPAQVSILPIALLPLSFGYALLRYHLFDTTVRVRRVLARLGWGLALSGAAMLLMRLVADWRALPLARGTLAVGGVGLGLFVAVVVIPLTWRQLDRLLFADVYDERRTLHELTAGLATGRDPQQIGSRLCERLAQAMATHFVAILTPTHPAHPLLAASAPLQSALARALVDGATTVAADNPLAPGLDATDPVALWVPLRTGGLLYGLLAVGPKRNDEPFSRTDRHLLSTIAGTAAAALHGAELTKQLRRRAGQLSHLNHQLTGAHEQERRALARDLHDGPLQRLTLVAHLLDTPEMTAASGAIHQQSLAAIAELRNLCHTLRTSVLDDLGLADALEALVEEARPQTTATLSFSADAMGGVVGVRAGTDSALYRVAQEALTNCLRHAEATAIAVQLTVIGAPRPRLCLSIVDRGRGFIAPADMLSLIPSGHYGLAGMAERVQGLGGQLTVQSTAGVGTRVVAEVPLVQEATADERR